MGACCQTGNKEEQLNLNENSDKVSDIEKIQIKKELQTLKEEITSPSITTSYYSDSENELAFRRVEIEKNRKFAQELLKEFNLIRTKPMIYLKKIDAYQQTLKYMNNSLMLEIEGVSYPLNSSSSFDDLINYIDPCSELDPFEFKEELVITLPKDVSLIQSYDYMANQFVMKKLGLSNKYTYFSFHHDQTIRNAETSAFLQLLDDSNPSRQRRRNILNPAFSSVGISIGKISEDKYYCYIVFAG